MVASRRACVLFGFSGLIFGRLGFGFSGLVCGVGIADIDCEVQMLAFVPKMNLLAGLYWVSSPCPYYFPFSCIVIWNFVYRKLLKGIQRSFVFPFLNLAFIYLVIYKFSDFGVVWYVNTDIVWFFWVPLYL